jgi:hypothetical protein
MMQKEDDAKPLQLRSRITQTLDGEMALSEVRTIGGRSSVRQEPSKGRTGHTKCGMYLLGPSFAAALLDELFHHPLVRAMP